MIYEKLPEIRCALLGEFAFLEFIVGGWPAAQTEEQTNRWLVNQERFE